MDEILKKIDAESELYRPVPKIALLTAKESIRDMLMGCKRQKKLSYPNRKKAKEVK